MRPRKLLFSGEGRVSSVGTDRISSFNINPGPGEIPAHIATILNMRPRKLLFSGEGRVSSVGTDRISSFNINPGPGEIPAHIATSAKFLDVIRLIWS